MQVWGDTQSFTNSDINASHTSATKSSITLSIGGSVSTSGSQFRFSNAMTVSSSAGNITRIDVSTNSTETYISPLGNTVSSGTWNKKTTTSYYWEGNSTSVTLTPSSAIRITNVTVTYEASTCSKTVTITKGAETNGKYTLSATSICGDTPGGTINITDITPASGYEFDEITTSASGSVDNENKRVTGITKNTTITVKFKSLPTYAIRFFNNGTQVGATQNIAVGGTPDVPADPAACDEGYTFVGWWTAELTEDNTTAYTWVTDFTVSGAQDYYAVFSVAGAGGGSKEFIFSDIATAEGWVPETDNHYDITLSPINIYVTKGSADYRGRWWSDNTWRIYNGNTVTISSSSGNITSVTSSPSQTFSISAGVATLGASATIKFTSITVNYGTTYYTTDCGSACSTPTLEFDVTEVNKFKGDVPFIKTATLSNNPLGGTITYSSSLPSKAEVNATTGEVTIHEAMSSTPVVITATVNKVTSGVECQKKVTASYTLNIYNRVTWLVNGASYSAGAPTTQTTEGGEIETFPTDPDGSTACGGKTFVGWTTAPYAESDTKPTTLYTSLSDMSGVHITDNTIYYAVFAEVGGESENQYKKVTSPASEMTTGKRVVIVHNSSSKAMSNTESGDGYAGVSVTPDGEGKITTTNEGTEKLFLRNCTFCKQKLAYVQFFLYLCSVIRKRHA